ncbi:MAG: hypothetical protein WCJ29_04505 [bacterium]
MTNEKNMREQEGTGAKKTSMYSGFKNELEGIADLDVGLPQEISLAWMTERLSQKYPEQWEQTFEKVNQKSRELNNAFEVSHFLANFIGRLYQDFLEEEKNNAGNDLDRSRIELLISMLKLKSKNIKKLEEKKEICNFGGVNIDYAPNWYLTEKAKSEKK